MTRILMSVSLSAWLPVQNHAVSTACMHTHAGILSQSSRAARADCARAKARRVPVINTEGCRLHDCFRNQINHHACAHAPTHPRDWPLTPHMPLPMCRASVSSAAASHAFRSHTSLQTSVHTPHTASLVLSPPTQPLLMGATAVLGVAAVASATRSFFSVRGGMVVAQSFCWVDEWDGMGLAAVASATRSFFSVKEWWYRG